MVADSVTLLHFTDVYHLAARRTKEPVGGAARLHTLLKSFPDPLILFSGDAFSPSLESQTTQGGHMVDALNKLAVDAAVLGNHEFDFGLENLEEQVERSSFPWLLSNVSLGETGAPPPGVLRYQVLERGGRRIGLMGLVGDWMWKQVAVRQHSFTYSDPVEVGSRLAAYLRHEEHCDAVVALTHMDLVQDISVATGVLGLDVVLGGHNHGYSATKQGNGVWVVKSGTEFRHLSKVDLSFASGRPVEVKVERRDVTSDLSPAEGWATPGLSWSGRARSLPGYGGWAARYHGFKILARLRRL